MSIDELKSKVKAYRMSLRTSSQLPVFANETSPVGMGIIEILVAAIETQQQQIDELRRKINNGSP